MYELLAREPFDAFDAFVLLLEPPAWHRHAACRDADPEVFFPERGESLEPARALCATCLVTSECRREALSDVDGTIGVWAGTSKKQRMKMRRTAA